MADAKADLHSFVKRAMQEHPYIQSVQRALRSGSYTGAEVDKATGSLGLQPALYNLALSNRMRTCLGDGLHVPVAISAREGGRKSLLSLETGEEVQTGTILVEARAYHQSFTRLKGAGKTDYLEKMKTADGKLVFRQIYQLNAVEQQKDMVHLRPYASGFKSSMDDVIIYRNGICYVCIGSIWWCGLPCLPIPKGPDTDQLDRLLA